MILSKESDYKTMVLFFVVSVVIVILYLGFYLAGIIQLIEDLSWGLIHRTLILNSLLLVTTVFGILILYGKLQGRDVGLVVKRLPIAIAIGLVTWILVQIIEGIMGYVGMGSIELNQQWNTEGLALIGLLIGMLFGTALYEEVGYRGFFLIQFSMRMKRVVENKYLQVIIALIISQALFTILHIPWKVMNQGWTIIVLQELLFSVFMNGVIYGLLYLRTGNLFFVMIVHALGNAPTSLVNPVIEPSNILLLIAIIWAVIWPKLQRWERNSTIQSAADSNN
ncbi:MAG: lysostaphin resistance A-like protein [Candidatus Thorarchaeota archaeon]